MADVPDDWANWLDRHGPAMLLFARQWVPSQTDAEDIVQEAFVRFWRQRQQAHDASSYLFACVKSCALDWLRSRQRRLRREESRAVTEPAFDTTMETFDRTSAIEAGMRSLPEDQREVLVLKIWGGLSFAQIGDSLNISTNTAASRYRYALAKLREQLAEESKT